MINILEIGATFFGLLQGYLVMLNKRSNWIAYSIQMVFMILFSLSMHLYGDVANSSIYLILGIIGLKMMDGYMIQHYYINLKKEINLTP